MSDEFLGVLLHEQRTMGCPCELVNGQHWKVNGHDVKAIVYAYHSEYLGKQYRWAMYVDDAHYSSGTFPEEDSE